MKKNKQKKQTKKIKQNKNTKNTINKTKTNKKTMTINRFVSVFSNYLLVSSKMKHFAS
jgi:hypothetical protein